MAKKKPLESEEIKNEEILNDQIGDLESSDVYGLDSKSEGINPEEQDLIDQANSPELEPEKTEDKEPEFDLNSIDERKEYTIVLTKKFHGQKELTEKRVSGNVAKALIKKKYATLK